MKKYWKSIESKNRLDENSEPLPEFSIDGLSEDEIQSKTKPSRRDFLKILGFSIGYASIATSCETPIKKAIPFLIKPEEITPGIAAYYASTYFDGKDYASILVKTREGRPIKIEGNELSTISRGGTTARVQASLLSLYDNNRLKKPTRNSVETNWGELDTAVTSGLANAKDGNVVFLTGTCISPSARSLKLELKAKYPGVRFINYDPISSSAMLVANQLIFGKQAIPSYRFDSAKIIVAFNADFLGTWLSPIEFSKQYAENRKVSKVKGGLSKHYHFESAMSLSGSNADYRIQIRPSQEGTILLNIYNGIAKAVGASTQTAGSSPVEVDTIIADLLSNKSKSLVISGTNDESVQIIVNAINSLLENYGSTIDLTKPLKTRMGIDSQMQHLIEDMKAGKVATIIVNNVNPAYDYPNVNEFANAFGQIKNRIVLCEAPNETSALAEFAGPLNHYLESWGDAEPIEGKFSLTQPTIQKLFDTYQFEECLLKWSGRAPDYYAYLKSFWEGQLFKLQSNHISPTGFWNESLQTGIFESPANLPTPLIDLYAVPVIDSVESTETEIYLMKTPETEQVADLTTELAKATVQLGVSNEQGTECVLYESIGLGDGRMANNPWLQELPDPITKLCWDNALSVSPKYAKEMNLSTGDVVRVNSSFDIPVIVQPGQAYGTVAIPLGYGRTIAGKVADNLGINAFSLTTIEKGHRSYSTSRLRIDLTGQTSEMAITQEFHTMYGRDIVRETTLDQYLKHPASGNEAHEEVEAHSVSLYKKPEYIGHHWGMAIDLNTCTGCSNCVISCQAENNIPVIGKHEVKNRRIMHWMRIDRYYSDDEDNPKVYHMPVMCQHCDNAPCENVCPVAATPHGEDGLNQMAYNRCIGTRYCMNNCPYRVRRFNWYAFSDNDKFDYNLNNDLGKMALNPDVVVRSRGVVEKCSFCIQRIQEKKLQAKKEGRKLNDQEIKPACMQSCPSNAIIFGDLSDENSTISHYYKDERNYHLLEELHTLPSVGYLTKVRNIKADDNA